MRTFTHNYESDITREQYELVRKELENARKSTKPRDIDLYSVFCAILYLIKSGCQWRMLPENFPKRGIVRYYYDMWNEPDEHGVTLLNCVLKKIGRNAPKR
jgi:transposase